MTIPIGTFSVQITNPISEIEKMVLQAMRDKLNPALDKAVPNILKDVQFYIKNVIRQTTTYDSLLKGILRLQFGIPSGDEQARLDSILETIARNIEVRKVRVSVRGGTRLGGGIIISMIRATFDDILSLPAASVTTANGQSLPWLDWLLIRGDDIIISEHDLRYIPGKGRSGGAVMVDNNAGVWRVPPQFSGTEKDNWLTRAVLDLGTTLHQNISDIVEKNILGAF